MAVEAGAGGAGGAGGADRRRGLRVRLGSVRVRTTALATVVVGLTLALGGVALVLALRVGLTRSVERAVRQQAAAAAEVVSTTGRTPRLVEGEIGGDDDTVAQILDGDGNVLASSPALSDHDEDDDADGPHEDEAADPDEVVDPATVEPLAPGLTPGHKTTVKPSGDEDRYLAVAVATRTPDGDRRTVVVAGTLEVVEESAQIVGFLLTLGLPLLLLVVAVTTWRMVSRALAPVEAIRTTAEGVSVADLSGRVPTPTSADEVARLATTMNHMLDRLEEGQTRQRRFVADASHELRSPVAVLRQHAEVARAHPDRTTPDELAGTVLAEALRMQRLVDDLLLLARADEHSLGLRRRPLDLDDVVLDEVRRLRATSSVAVDAGAVSAGPVDGDVEALRRAVRNVVDNASRHAAGRMAVALSLRPSGSARPSGDADGVDGEAVVLTVDDDGPGVPPDQRDRVFERFVRLDDARARDGGGSGLGLAIVAEVVAAHGGTVELTASPSLGGARFVIALPARA